MYDQLKRRYNSQKKNHCSFKNLVKKKFILKINCNKTYAADCLVNLFQATLERRTASMIHL